MKLPSAAPNTPLLEGERLLQSWQPQLVLFSHRAFLLSFATALALASLGYLSFVQWLIVVPVFTVIFVIVFDDVATWFRCRDDRWFLTSKRLIFERVGAPEENANLTLDRVEWMQPWFWWSLRIGFSAGTATVIRFVPRPREVRSRILEAKAAFEDGAHD